MPWKIVRHWAELALLLAVIKMFESCHNLDAGLQVVGDADDLTRLGMVTALAIASSGLGDIVHSMAHSLHLPSLWLWMVKRIQRKP